MMSPGILSTLICYAAAVFILFSACEQDRPPLPEPEEVPLSAFAGSWSTPGEYRDHERAEMRADYGDGEISGYIRYSADPDSETDGERMFFSGEIVGVLPEIEIRDREGNRISTARLTKRNGLLHIQLLSGTDRLPRIFVLKRTE